MKPAVSIRQACAQAMLALPGGATAAIRKRAQELRPGTKDTSVRALMDAMAKAGQAQVVRRCGGAHWYPMPACARLAQGLRSKCSKTPRRELGNADRGIVHRAVGEWQLHDREALQRARSIFDLARP